MIRRLLSFALLAFVLHLILARPAYAYLDPGTGSFACQILLAGLVTTLFLLKTYWRRFVAALTRLDRRKVNE